MLYLSGKVTFDAREWGAVSEVAKKLIMQLLDLDPKARYGLYLTHNPSSALFASLLGSVVSIKTFLSPVPVRVASLPPQRQAYCCTGVSPPLGCE
jgi:hypothetical protein